MPDDDELPTIIQLISNWLGVQLPTPRMPQTFRSIDKATAEIILELGKNLKARIARNTAKVRADNLSRRRPRLMATNAAIARTRSTVERNDTAKALQAELAQRADYMLTLPPLTPNAVLDPRETAAAPLPLVRSGQTSGKPGSALDIARQFGLRIQTLGLTWFLTGDTRYRDRAKAELLAVCGFPDWDGDEFLVTAETAFGAGIGFDWLYDALDEEERRRVVAAILDKAIGPGLRELARSPPPPQRWVTAPTNWNLVCNGGLMIAALAIAEEDPRALVLLALARDAVRNGFDGYSPDGGWIEGPGYWHYATQYAIYLLDSLDTALGTDWGLDSSLGLSRTGFFRLHIAGPSGKHFNFADSEEKHSGGYWLFWLARRYNHPVDAWIERHRGAVHPMDLLWFDDNQRDPSRLPRARHFRGPEVATLRGGWNPTDSYLGIKGGVNDSCRHAHYDLGSFVLDALGVRWAIDLGPDNYGLPGYFDPKMKVLYYRTGTIGHNTLVLDGECQPPTADAAVVRSRFRKRLALGVIDLSVAYPQTARVLRGFALIDGRHALIVDEIVPDAALASVDWQMHTRARVEQQELAAALSHAADGNGGEPARCFLRVLEGGQGALSVMPATPSGPPGQDPNDGVLKIVLRLEEVARPLRLAVLLTPDAAFSANPRLPAALRQPLSEWAQPTGHRRRR